MIERIVTVKSATFVETADKSKKYLSAVLVNEDGKENKQAVFDPDLQKIIQDACKEEYKLSVKLEKEGNFWNLKEAKVATVAELEEPKTEQRFYHDRHSQDAEDWTNIRTAVMQAVALETHHVVPEGKTNIARTMQDAQQIFASMLMMKPKRTE